jgi:hypothetical protein
MWLDVTIYIRMAMLQHTEFVMNKLEQYKAALSTMHAAQAAYETARQGHHNLMEQQEAGSHAVQAWNLARDARTALAIDDAGLEGNAAHAALTLARAFGHGWVIEPEDAEGRIPGIQGPVILEDGQVFHTTGGGSLTWNIEVDGEVILTNDLISSVNVRCWKAVSGRWVASGTIPLNVIQTREPMDYRLPRIRACLRDAVTSLCGEEEWLRLLRACLRDAVTSLCGEEEWLRLLRVNEEFGQ